jgi:hypothetical protein
VKAIKVSIVDFDEAIQSVFGEEAEELNGFDIADLWEAPD